MLIAIHSQAPVVFAASGADVAFWAVPVLIFSAFSAISGFVFAMSPDDVQHKAARAGLFVLGSAGIFGVLFSFTQLVTANNAHNAARASHSTEVSTWLTDDYDIETTESSLDKLIDGESLTADYDGRQVVITLGETTTGLLSVIGENRTVLAPLAD